MAVRTETPSAGCVDWSRCVAGSLDEVVPRWCWVAEEEDLRAAEARILTSSRSAGLTARVFSSRSLSYWNASFGRFPVKSSKRPSNLEAAGFMTPRYRHVGQNCHTTLTDREAKRLGRWQHVRTMGKRWFSHRVERSNIVLNMEITVHVHRASPGCPHEELQKYLCHTFDPPSPTSERCGEASSWSSLTPSSATLTAAPVEGLVWHLDTAAEHTNWTWGVERRSYYFTWGYVLDYFLAGTSNFSCLATTCVK